jgi:hypothetical protein
VARGERDRPGPSEGPAGRGSPGGPATVARAQAATAGGGELTVLVRTRVPAMSRVPVMTPAPGGLAAPAAGRPIRPGARVVTSGDLTVLADVRAVLPGPAGRARRRARPCAGATPCAACT